MSGLSAFLKQNAVQEENTFYPASKRFLDDDGKPVEWEIKTIDSAADEALRRECTKRVQVPGKRNQFLPELDYNQYLGKLAAACTVFPNLKDADLQNSYGVMGDDALLKAMLKSGEYAGYQAKIQEINGFDIDMGTLVDEAKN